MSILDRENTSCTPYKYLSLNQFEFTEENSFNETKMITLTLNYYVIKLEVKEVG